MNFVEAFKELINGESIRLKHWIDSFYIKIVGDDVAAFAFGSRVPLPNAEQGENFFGAEDVLSEDWELYADLIGEFFILQEAGILFEEIWSGDMSEKSEPASNDAVMP